LKGTVTSNTKGKRIFLYRLSPETFGYTFVCTYLLTHTQSYIIHTYNHTYLYMVHA